MEEVLYLVSGLSTEKEAWKALEESLAQDTKDCERSLIMPLHNCKKDSSYNFKFHKMIQTYQ